LPEKVPVSLIAILAVWIILALPAVALPASPEIFLQEEPETYLVIDKLEGMGFLPGLMTGDRGLEAREVSREAEKAEGAGDPFVDGMLRFLRLGAARRHDFRLRAGLEHSGDGRVPPNAQGWPVAEGGGIRAGGFFRTSPADWISLQARGDLLAGSSGGDTGRIEETSLSPWLAAGNAGSGPLFPLVGAGKAREPSIHDQCRTADRGPDPQPAPDPPGVVVPVPGIVPVRYLHFPAE